MRRRKLYICLAVMALFVACNAEKKTNTDLSEVKDGLFWKGREITPAKSIAVSDTANAVTAATKKFFTHQKEGAPVMFELPAVLDDRPEQILWRKGYTVSYNKQTKNPNWVAWHLTKNHTYGRVQRSQETFTEDTSVPAPRATDWDYYNSRFDRGHMCPAGDNKWDAEAMTQSFLFTNICPQNHGLNKYEWNDVEMLCREWARRFGAVDIVCGPIYDANATPRYVGRNKVRIPDRFFKVVLCRTDSPKAIAFIYDNIGKKQKMQEHVYTVDEVERITGINFFVSLPDSIEEHIETKASLSEWPMN